MRQIILRSIAEREMLAAMTYYESRSRGLGEKFLDSLERVLDLIQQYPQSAPITTGEIRRSVIGGFPFAVLYRVSEDIDIVCIMDTRREPDYWVDRL